ncbi:hypothetical protein AgCh_031185 [Apium graveolens]
MTSRKTNGGMGFRSIRDFNIALIGKQSWRLLVHPEKLVSRIFKARYYSSGSFMTTKLDADDPYVHSTHEALLNQNVSALMVTGENSWDSDLIHDLFDDHDAGLILNDLVWNKKRMDISEVLFSAISVLNKWQYVQDKSFNNTLSFLTQNEGQDKWQALEVNRVKVNVDAALFDSPARYSFALVVRDHSGKLLEAVSKCCRGTINPALAEAI